LYRIEIAASKIAMVELGKGCSQKRLIERRRVRPQVEKTSDQFLTQDPHSRRESDLLRMRLQHWIELADAALRTRRSSKPQNPKSG
jgi:hypothetical protein